MALKGSLGTFDIISVIQMITSQQATGVLHIKGEDKKDEFDILIDKGSIVKMVPLFETPVKYIAERLAKAGLLEPGQLKVVLDTIKKEGLSEADVPKRFPVSASSIKKLMFSINYESLYTMYRLKNGSYEFESKEIEYDRQFNEPINTEFLLIESSRVVDEVTHLNWRYGNNIVFKKTAAIKKRKPVIISDSIKEGDKKEFVPEKASVLSNNESQYEPAEMGKYTSSEKIILKLIDGKRTSGEVYYMSLLSRNEVILGLANLLKTGKINISHEIKNQFRSTKASLLPGFVRGVINGIRSFIIFLLSFAAIMIVLYYSKVNPFRQKSARINITYANLLRYIGNYQRTKISNALEIYKLRYGVYPNSLTALVDRHIISSKDLIFPYGNEYYYTIQDGTYILLAPKYAAR